MPLQKQEIQLPFAAGVDTKTDPRVMPMGKLLDVQNAEIVKTGSLQKRSGHAALAQTKAAGGSISAATGLVVRKNELLLQEGSRGWFGFREGDDGDQWTTKGPVMPARPSVQSVPVNAFRGTTDNVLDFVTAKSTSGTVYGIVAHGRDAIGVYVTIFDMATGAVVLDSSEVIATGSAVTQKIRLVSTTDAGGIVYLVYRSGTTSTIKCASIDIDNPDTISANYNIVTNAKAAKNFEAVSYGGTWGYLLYQDTSDNLKVISFGEGAVIGTAATLAASITSIGDATDDLQVFYEDGSNDLQVIVWTEVDTPAVEYGPNSVSASYAGGVVVAGAANSGSYCVFVDGAGTGNATTLKVAKTIANGTVSSVSALAFGFYPVSKPKYLGASMSPQTNSCVVALTNAFSGTSQKGISIVDLANSNAVVARVAQSIASWSAKTAGSWSQTPQININATGGAFFVPVQVNRVQDVQAFELHRFDFGSAFSPRFVECADAAIIAGPVPQHYDGGSVVPLGLPHYPYLQSVTPATSGGNMADGTYGVSAVYSWVDAAGRVHRSAPAEVLSGTISGGGGSGKLTVVVQNCTLAADIGDGLLTITLYRTLAGGSIYYRATDVANDSTAATQSVVLSANDATVGANALLYTTGAELDSIPPPAVRALTLHGKRLVVAAAGGRLWPSKPIEDGVAPEFNDSLILSAKTGGEVNALASMDGRLVIFYAGEIYCRDGEGPNKAGQGSFSDERVVPSAVGAIANSPTLVTDLGCWFVSSRGIELLTRSMQVVWAGAPVENAYTGNIVSIVNVPEKNQIRFHCDSGDSVVFDYHEQQWLTFTGITGKAAVQWQNLYTYVTSAGLVYQQDSSYKDGSTSYALLAETAWIQPSGAQGWERVYWIALLGDFKSAHTFQVQMFVDYSETAVETVTLASTTDPGPLQLRFKPTRQKCQAFKLRITETNPAGTEQGFVLQHLRLQIGIKGGAARLSSAKTL